MYSGTGLDQQRLLPPHLEDRLLGWAGRIAGYVLVAILAFVWVSILSWTLTDPSLTHATGGGVRNWLGGLGAIVSDLLLQTLGFATAIALLPPMFWAIELISGERILNFRLKSAFYPLSVLLIAGGLSSIPIPEAWPLHHGLGGILGDLVHGLGTTLFGLLNPERAGLAAGLLLTAAGIASLSQSIGHKLSELGRMLATPRGVTGSWHQGLRAEAERLAGRLGTAAGFAHGGIRADNDLAADLANPPWNAPLHRAEASPAFEALLRENAAAAPNAMAPRARRRMDREDALDMSDAHDDDFGDDGRIEPSFEETTERASRRIAERFAPSQGEPRHAEPRLPSTTKPTARSSRSVLLGGLAFQKSRTEYKRPSLNILKRAPLSRPAAEFAQTVLRGNAGLLQDVLMDFGVKGDVREIKPGPVVTLYEFEPARGIKSSRVIALADDIARSMSAQSVRVAVIPGRNAIGIELPNMRREPVMLRDILEAQSYKATELALPLALGKSISGEPIVADLARMPHLLVAGTTGSGKSVGVNAMILSLLYRYGPEDCRFLMIDPKMLELSVYNGIPHLIAPVVTDPKKAVSALNWVVAEMEERYKRMAKLSVRNIDVYNNRVRNAIKRGEMISRTVQTGFDRRTGEAVYEREDMAMEPMPFIVVVIDEFADLMIVAGKEIEALVQRLAQMARAAGIHIIMATQRPSVDVITGTIKANFPTRISFKVASKIDSRTILNDQGAEQLLGQGDMLYAAGGGQPIRVHGAFVADEEVESIAAALRAEGEPNYVEGVLEVAAGGEALYDEAENPRSADDLFDRAVAIVLRDRKASTSYIQRRLSIGYNRAADLMERMEQQGIVGPANHAGKRDILGPADSAADDDAA